MATPDYAELALLEVQMWGRGRAESAKIEGMEVGDMHSRILTTGAAGSVFCVTEKWIRRKLNLTKTPVGNCLSW